MKKLGISLLLVLGSLSIQAQELYWETNVTKAIGISKETKKPLLLFFTGSDWCGWCIRLQKEVLKTPEFAAWAKQNVVLVELDYPRNRPQSNAILQQNGQMQQVFGIQGYPAIHLVTFTETKGKINFKSLGNTGYVAGGPNAWISLANDFLKKK